MANLNTHKEDQYMIAVIDDIEIDQRIAHCRTNRGGMVKAHWRVTESLFQIPQQGERWKIVRQGSTQWELTKRIDTQDEADSKAGNAESGKIALQAGDGHMRISGNLLMEASSITLRQSGSVNTPKPLGATYRERFVTSGSTTSWTLNLTPLSATLMLFNNGSLVDPDTVTISNNVISFASIATGHTLVAYYQAIA